MARSITLTRKLYPATDISTDYRMTVEAIAVDMPAEVFTLQRLTNDESVFVAVCSPTTLEEYSTLTPYPESSYYRTDAIELVASNLEALDEMYDYIEEDIQLLISNLNSMDTLATTTTRTLNGTTVT